VSDWERAHVCLFRWAPLGSSAFDAREAQWRRQHDERCRRERQFAEAWVEASVSPSDARPRGEAAIGDGAGEASSCATPHMQHAQPSPSTGMVASAPAAERSVRTRMYATYAHRGVATPLSCDGLALAAVAPCGVSSRKASSQHPKPPCTGPQLQQVHSQRLHELHGDLGPVHALSSASLDGAALAAQRGLGAAGWECAPAGRTVARPYVRAAMAGCGDGGPTCENKWVQTNLLDGELDQLRQRCAEAHRRAADAERAVSVLQEALIGKSEEISELQAQLATQQARHIAAVPDVQLARTNAELHRRVQTLELQLQASEERVSRGELLVRKMRAHLEGTRNGHA